MATKALTVPNQPTQIDPQAIEKVLLGGDLAALDSAQRLSYYKSVCESVGLNPLTKPFEYLELDGKIVLYARRDCTDQLRKIHNISVKIVAREAAEGVYVCTAQAAMPDGRQDESIGAVPLVKEIKEWVPASNGKKYPKIIGTEALGPADKANAIMKAETKSKRRVTLSICGLGFLDESELDSIPGARPYFDNHPEPEPEKKPAATTTTNTQQTSGPPQQSGNVEHVGEFTIGVKSEAAGDGKVVEMQKREVVDTTSDGDTKPLDLKEQNSQRVTKEAKRLGVERSAVTQFFFGWFGAANAQALPRKPEAYMDALKHLEGITTEEDVKAFREDPATYGKAAKPVEPQTTKVDGGGLQSMFPGWTPRCYFLAQQAMAKLGLKAAKDLGNWLKVNGVPNDPPDELEALFTVCMHTTAGAQLPKVRQIHETSMKQALIQLEKVHNGGNSLAEAETSQALYEALTKEIDGWLE